jgi:hypothetical protein
VAKTFHQQASLMEARAQLIKQKADLEEMRRIHEDVRRVRQELFGKTFEEKCLDLLDDLIELSETDEDARTLVEKYRLRSIPRSEWFDRILFSR